MFKKSSPNGKITVYLGKRDFVDHITHVDPIGEYFRLKTINVIEVRIFKKIILKSRREMEKKNL